VLTLVDDQPQPKTLPNGALWWPWDVPNILLCNLFDPGSGHLMAHCSFLRGQVNSRESDEHGRQRLEASGAWHGRGQVVTTVRTQQLHVLCIGRFGRLLPASLGLSSSADELPAAVVHHLESSPPRLEARGCFGRPRDFSGRRRFAMALGASAPVA
jgi:hypothetical protein